MKTLLFLFSSNSCMLLLLLASPFLSRTAQSSFVPVEWTPEVLPSQQCGLASISDVSDALATVAQLVKSNDVASSLPKSCMEIKESSPVSPSGYYTISNGSGGSVVVYCNMDELYSCPSLEQTLKGFSSTLERFNNTMAGVSSTVTEVASTLTGVSNNVTGISSNLTGVSNNVTGISNTLTGVSNDVTEMSSTLTDVSTDVTGMTSTLTAVSNDVTEISSTLIELSTGITVISNNLTGVSSDVTEMSDALTGVSSDVIGLSITLMGVSNNVTGTSSTLKEVVHSCSLAANCSCERASTSCQEVWDKCPKCTSGYYKILAADLTENYVYCSFDRCGIAGPWTRVAYLNMSDSGSVCPSGTQKFVSGSAIACGIQEPSDATCVSITNSITHTYSEICGQMAGYQKGSSDGFSGISDINGYYVDGVSITRGSPRQHVWTYASGHQENYGGSGCSCGQVQDVAGSDFYCESGCPGTRELTTIYADDVLWDGQQCGAIETACCSNPDQPWFHKVLDAPTLDNIEIRLCINQATSDENVLVSLYEIYIK